MSYILSEQQRTDLLALLAELPAKHSFQHIIMLQQLSPIQEKIELKD